MAVVAEFWKVDCKSVPFARICALPSNPVPVTVTWNCEQFAGVDVDTVEITTL